MTAEAVMIATVVHGLAAVQAARPWVERLLRPILLLARTRRSTLQSPIAVLRARLKRPDRY